MRHPRPSETHPCRPGLRPSDLHEGRDLKPTLALEALIASASAQAFGLDPQRVGRTLFPQGPTLPVLNGLLRA